MSKIIPYGKQHITEKDILAVTETLQSDFLTQGPEIEKFEKAFASYIGSDYAVALANGTAALHLAVMALGIEEGEYVICTPITFSASVNCVRYCGGKILFADIDPETYLMDLENVKQVFETNKDKKIRGIIPVDFAGRVPQLDEFKEFAKQHDLWILEDACHAPGGSYISANNSTINAGQCLDSDAAIFSFHPVKHIATGEGGMVTTNSKEVYEKLLIYRTHGITRDFSKFKNSIEFASGNTKNAFDTYPLWYMEMQELGYNYRLTDFQAALGITQLERADEGIKRRREIAKKYTDELNSISGVINTSGFNENHAYHLYILEVENRRELYEYLRAKNIFCQIHYIPVHTMPYYQDQGFKIGDFPHAERYYSRCISIPMFPTLTEEEQTEIILLIKNFY
ncbi:MAG: UDP-4-amino-4,6-dideoxy-N-acetyl-beta-L-altrosamine transaminase [Fluviicola sp.]|jgi:UDP-4-amino-4,6-dideoxy-N-acetyl-beta-L-altrosamine transaminase